MHAEGKWDLLEALIAVRPHGYGARSLPTTTSNFKGKTRKRVTVTHLGWEITHGAHRDDANDDYEACLRRMLTRRFFGGGCNFEEKFYERVLLRNFAKSSFHRLADNISHYLD